MVLIHWPEVKKKKIELMYGKQWKNQLMKVK